MAPISRRGLLAGLGVGLALRSCATSRPQPVVAATPTRSPLPAQSSLPSRAEILAVLRRVNDHWIGANTNPGNNQWARSAYFTGNLALYRATGEPRYLAYATSWAEQANYAINDGVATRNADNHCAGQVYYHLHDIAPDPAKVAAINESIRLIVYGSQPARNDDWSWVDTLHMAMPVFARVAAYTHDDAYLTKLWSLYSYPKHTLRLYDEAYERWYRDSRFTPPSGQRSPNGKPVFWSRGNGWAMAGHAKTLALLGPAEARWPEYRSNIQALARSLLATQREDGFWNVNLGDSADRPGPETSGTGFFTFGLAYGIRTGLLDRATYLPVAARAWRGMVTVAVRDGGFLGYVQGVGEQPASGATIGADDTADFGVGAFLLAGTELAKLLGG
jgi:rhamnogalacturonyl hydrolase YesR